VDLGVRKAAVTVLDDNQMLFTGAFDVSAQKPRSTQLHQVAAWVVRQLIQYKAEAVYVEEPLVGRSTRVSLQIAQTAGAVLCTTDHLLDADGAGANSYLVSNTHWKKILLGSGNANKVKIQEWLDLKYSSYALNCDGDQDCYDATCIALYGQLQQGLAARLREDSQTIQHGQALA
jgi:Holliday junction resolvasome RuvABC endonuclease subunit